MTLELHNVTKKFGTKVAVNDLSFRVEPGKIL
ncbi:sodium ABC transporter ATP-binding protein, partial [Listeria monocytogenes]|nr:sodium ABC transporter ATP-binding protein [Listeria monocytogenes]